MSTKPDQGLDLDSIENLIRDRSDKYQIAVEPELVPALAAHLGLLMRWRRTTSLTSIRVPEELVDHHILESLVAAPHVGNSSGRYMDIGSGNGYPALPILSANPGLEGLLLEPNMRKSVFLKQAIDASGLSGVEVQRMRLESPDQLYSLGPLRAISMRAVNALSPLLAGAPRALKPGGRLLLFLGDDHRREVAEAGPPAFGVIAEHMLPGRDEARLVVLERSSIPA